MIRLSLMVVGVLGTMELQAQTSARFSATVRAGEGYTHRIGHGLYFALDQTDGGDWNFQIRPSQKSRESYTDCLGSPVMHGPGTTDLLAWRFAPDADAGWAEHLPARKRFAFVATAADQRYECAEKDAVYESFQRSQSAGQMPSSSRSHCGLRSDFRFGKEPDSADAGRVCGRSEGRVTSSWLPVEPAPRSWL